MSLPLLLFWLTIFPAVSDPMPSVRSAINRGNLDLALRLLDEIRNQRPEEFEWNQLGYLRGVLLHRQGRDEAARAELEPLVESGFSLSDSALLHLIAASEGLPEVKARHTERFLDRFPTHPRWPSLALAHGRQLKAAGYLDQAKIWLDRAWSRGRGSISRQAALEHALLHLDRDETGEAIRDLQRILAKGERDDTAAAAARRLHQLQPMSALGEGELRRRVRVFLNNRDGETAREYLKSARERFPRSLAADQYAFLWGRSLVVDNRFEAALEAYQQAYRQFPESSWGVYSLYRSGNLALRMFDYERAEQFYQQLVTRHPSSRYAARAWFNLADTHLWLGRPQAARETLREALKQTSRREHVQFRYALARLDLMENRFEAALDGLERIDHLSSRRLPSGVTREEVLFLEGLALEGLERSERAHAAYREAAAGRPNYFALAARNRLPVKTIPAPAEADIEWRERLIKPRPWRSAAPADSDSESRIRDLLFLHLFDEAALEIRRVGPRATGGDRTAQLFNLASYAERGGLPEESIRAAERLQSLAFSGKDPSDYPPIIRSLIYPRHYADLVDHYSRENGVDPELILSIIRQESRFQSDAKSIAAARGLMQFMTGTARALARELNLESPDAADLYRPELSVRLGTYYLAKLLNRFDGSVEKALAAYNAGPENVERWESKFEHPDGVFFVANIGFRETKLYVLKVMGNYFIYRQLAESTDEPLDRTAYVEDSR